MEKEEFNKNEDKFGNPFRETSFPKPLSIKEIVDQYREEKPVSLAGRVISKREHGKSGFAHLADSTGKIQIYARLNNLKQEFDLFKSLDIGDIIGVEGKLFTTRTEEITVIADKIKLLAKAQRPLPEKWHGLRDVEVRYRQRYLDLIANNEARDVFRKRTEIVASIRKFFENLSFVEVETPMLHHIPGGAAGRPFETFHNATSNKVYLRIAPELYLKRLLVGGFDKVFEINRSFRNEGLSRRHNPEFTMLEAYAAYFDYQFMMKACQDLFTELAEKFCGGLIFEYQGKKIDFTTPWQRISLAELFKKEFDIEPEDSHKEVVEKISKKINLKEGLSRSQILKLCEELIEKNYPQNRPAFITDFFTWTSPLAKKRKDNPNLVERFELFIAGIEVANAYSELNDPIEQKKRFIEQQKDKDLDNQLDQNFIKSLEYGMPPATGLGIGIDRLVMILLNQPSIRDVILFPLLKTKEGNDDCSVA
ncbi:MAG: lysine--tRNA ligase [Candidatus Omnitrophica bacterium]|nr:lysine--tRNA ligase [Candidatus Omnitrophota bacterium]MCF7891570.1 lysine--tRNA ligase [Candidatus Omnitrophota bacterium]MCF7898074.1 lysine--tRNA ligase [Candidatus Omnitrophota bacterium]MCF7909950.1 lysine--tRNA ligase [Candidatus Omnitrophota bacterium]